MPTLTLHDDSRGVTHRLTSTETIIGRDPGCGLVFSGDDAATVSGTHARVFFSDNKWWLEDLRSSNGTFRDGVHLEPGVRHVLETGVAIGLGLSGPRLRVLQADTRLIAATVLEASASEILNAVNEAGRVSAEPPGEQTVVLPADAHSPPRAADAPANAAADHQRSDDARVSVAVRSMQTGLRLELTDTVIRIGRSLDCQIHVEGESAAGVSRIHAELSVLDDRVILRDAGSRHGTYVNGKPLTDAHQVMHGDVLMLGAGGPCFTFESVRVLPHGTGDTDGSATVLAATEVAAVPPVMPPTEPPHREAPAPAAHPQPAAGPVTRFARASGNVGRTLLFKNAINEVTTQHARRTRRIVWSAAALCAALVGVGWWMANARVSSTERRMAATQSRLERTTAQFDTERAAATREAARLRASFDSAQRASAPGRVLDSLQNALTAAAKRTTTLEVQLQRAQGMIDRQLAAGDSARRVAQGDLERLRQEVAKAYAAGTASGASMDSLRQALRTAESRAKEIDGQLRAVQGANLAKISQGNEGAVGLVFAFQSAGTFSGTGFAITPSGYFLTNRHVVQRAGATTDSVVVILADQSQILPATVVAIAPANGPDVALIKISGYTGPYMRHVDWTSTHAVQGEPAALIGFPSGSALAFEGGNVARTSMSAGIFSKVTPELIQFDGFTIEGSSGSPVFNADGEIVAIHRAGLSGAVGLGFAVPMSQIVALLPADVKAELGIR